MLIVHSYADNPTCCNYVAIGVCKVDKTMKPHCLVVKFLLKLYHTLGCIQFKSLDIDRLEAEPAQATPVRA